MPRIARAVAPGEPHHVTQRFDWLTALTARQPPHGRLLTGKNRQAYPNLLREFGEKHGVLHFTQAFTLLPLNPSSPGRGARVMGRWAGACPDQRHV